MSVTDFILQDDTVKLIRRAINKSGKPSKIFAVLPDFWYQYCQPMSPQPAPRSSLFATNDPAAPLWNAEYNPEYDDCDDPL